MNHQPRTLVIATAGHIDHGKTTLVRALTGIDTDRLPEEKRRGITIDLGFASLDLQQPDGAPIRISFVDVPGHALFIRNMLAGAGGVPAVLLVVAADEGIKPQTIEHLSICELLGISRGIIAITKIDAVSKDHLNQILSNLRVLVDHTFLHDAPILPVSARSGEGLAALRAQFVSLALRTRAADPGGLIRLPIDRSFVMKGFGTVVTGTLLSGAIRGGQSLVLEPGNRGVRVRGLQTHGQVEHEALAGTRVAVNLSGIDASEVHRGQTLLASNTLAPVDIVDAEVRLLATAPLLKHGARVHFHAFTSEVMASISLYESQSVRPGETRPARLKFDQPVVLAPGDRFVLRQPAPVATIGGGRILDCHPEPRRRKAATRAWLEQLGNASVPEQILLRVRRRGAAGIRVHALSSESGLTHESAQRHLEPAIQSGELTLIAGDLLVSREGLQAARNQITVQIDRLARIPDTPSIKSSALRSQASLPREVFEFVISDLVREGALFLQGENLSFGGGPSSAIESDRLAAIALAYEAAGLAAPSVPELAQRVGVGDAEMRRLIVILHRQKTIVRMGSDDLFMHAHALDSLASRVRSLRGTSIDVASFKQLTGLSRKYAIPLLEYLDHLRITRKEGERRLVL